MNDNLIARLVAARLVFEANPESATDVSGLTAEEFMRVICEQPLSHEKKNDDE